MHGFGCYVRKESWKELFFLKKEEEDRQTETREERKRETNKYRVESANCNVSPTRQRLLLLTGETSDTSLQSNDHWPSDGKNNPHPCAQITALICLYLTVRGRERKRPRVHLLPSNYFICPGIQDRVRLDFYVNKLLSSKQWWRFAK